MCVYMVILMLCMCIETRRQPPEVGSYCVDPSG